MGKSFLGSSSSKSEHFFKKTITQYLLNHRLKSRISAVADCQTPQKKQFLHNEAFASVVILIRNNQYF